MTTARQILDPKHPVHKHFKLWVIVNSGHVDCSSKGVAFSLRQARKFLQAFPQYRG